MTCSFQIRRATKADALDIGRIHVEAVRAAYRGIYTDEHLAMLSPDGRSSAWLEPGKGHLAIEDRDFAVFVAAEESKTIGFADIGPIAFDDSRCAELYAIYLNSAYIGKGAGKILFRACVEHAKFRAYSSMKATVLSKNLSARKFYERMHGQPLLDTEIEIETGGTREKIITYLWPTII